MPTARATKRSRANTSSARQRTQSSRRPRRNISKRSPPHPDHQKPRRPRRPSAPEPLRRSSPRAATALHRNKYNTTNAWRYPIATTPASPQFAAPGASPLPALEERARAPESHAPEGPATRPQAAAAPAGQPPSRAGIVHGRRLQPTRPAAGPGRHHRSTASARRHAQPSARHRQTSRRGAASTRGGGEEQPESARSGHVHHKAALALDIHEVRVRGGDQALQLVLALLKRRRGVEEVDVAREHLRGRDGEGAR